MNKKEEKLREEKMFLIRKKISPLLYIYTTDEETDEIKPVNGYFLESGTEGVFQAVYDLLIQHERQTILKVKNALKSKRPKFDEDGKRIMSSIEVLTNPVFDDLFKQIKK